MDLRYIDYISTRRTSWLHRAPAWGKIAALVALIAGLLTTESVVGESTVLAGLLLVAVSARLPVTLFIPLMLYPVVFLAVLFLSVEGMNLASTATIALRVFDITGATVIMLLTTSYPAVFAVLARVLPGFLVAALFFTYRSLFLVWESAQDIGTAIHLRGGVNWLRPGQTVRRLGVALGRLVAHSIDASERAADGLTIRGFSSRIYVNTGVEDER